MTGRLVSPVTVGRRDELDAASRALDAAVAGSPRHLLVAGEAGVGKSRFVDELAEAARARGMRVLRGGCASLGEGGLPYAPIVEALRELALTLDPRQLADIVGPSGPDLARLVPALSHSPSPAPVQQQWLQARLLEALLGMLHRLAAQEPAVLVVEDIHWADPATRETLSFLVRNLRSERVLVGMTFRSDELHRRHPLLPWLAELDRTGRTDRIDLARLDHEGVHQLVAAILGSEPDRGLVEHIHRRSDGNPFFAEELLAAGRDEAGFGGLSATLREVLLARIATVPEEAQPLLGIVAVAGRRIDHDLLGSVVEASEAELLRYLRAAIASQVLTVEGGPDGDGYAFRHYLLQEVVYDELLPGERKRLHRRYAEALAERGAMPGAEDAAHWAELAYHWTSARDDHRAFQASLQAAEVAGRALAFEAAMRHYERALDLWTNVADPEQVAGVDHAEILSRAADAANLGGFPSRDVALRREAIASLDEAREPVRAAVMSQQLGRALWSHGDSAGALAASERGVAMMRAEPPTAERARVLAGHAQMLMLLDRWEDSRVLCEEAIEIARRVGARQAEGHALNTRGLDLSARGRCEEAIASLRGATDIALEVGNVDDIGRAQVNITDALFFCGLLEQAADAVDEGIRVADQFGISSTYGAFIRHNGILVNFDLGRWDRAAQLARESFEISHVGPHADRYGIARWLPLIVATGDFDGAKAQLQRLRELIEGAPIEAQFTGNYHIAGAELALWEGRPGDALDEVERGLARLGSKDWHWYTLRLLRQGAWAAADCADVARARRDRRAEAEALRRGIELAADRGRRIAESLAAQSGAQADETLAEAATADAEDSRLRGTPDPVAWRLAHDRWAARGRPYLLAYTAWRLAEALLATGDRAAAAEALGEADAVAARLGARPLREAVASLARRSRLELAGPAAPRDRDEVATVDRRAPADAFGLTPREREVLGLVALGRTNRQIADELFISENTAGVHVSNILGKLGVASRTEAAGVAVRLGYQATEPS